MHLEKTLNYVEKSNFFKNTFIKVLSSIKHGHLIFRDNGSELQFGNIDDSLHATINIIDPSFYRRIFLGGGLAFAESYMDRTWDTDNLRDALRILAKNMDSVDRIDHKFMTLILQGASLLIHLFDHNDHTGSRRNISKHYDLSNDFFKTFLDPTMMYSCAQFKDTEDLHQASLIKLDNICNRVEIKPSDHILEIGTGWGGFAIYAAQNYGCKVTTTTISTQQYNYVQERINDLGLNDQITLLLEDYRNLSGKYDKLVSIEMIEAVGHQYFSKYFSKCCSLVKDQGLCLIQAITIVQQRFKQARGSVDFIKKHIFPGGCLPSVNSIMQSIAKDTDYTLLNLENITIDYAKTLRAWRNNFVKNLADIKNLGFDEVFVRKWLYYLCYCEAGFLEQNIGTYQFLFNKPQYRSKEYIDYKDN